MKKLLCLVSIVFCVSLNLSAQVNLDAGLVSKWSFTGNAFDESVNGNDGTVYGAVLTSDRFGNANSAYEFDGISNYISIGTSSLVTGDKLTVSAWFKPTTVGPGSIISTGNQNDFAIALTAGTIYLYSNVYAGEKNEILNDVSHVNFGGWNHMILWYDGTVIKTYINGILRDTLVATGNISSPQPENLLIGAHVIETTTKAYQNFFSGKIDDISVYNRAVSMDEINALYRNGLCMETVTVTDTLVINVDLSSYNPVTYKNTIKIYPNPTSDKINIDFGDYAQMNNYSLTISNELAQVVYTTTINQASTEISLAGWTGKGLYFVTIKDGDGAILDVKKIILK